MVHQHTWFFVVFTTVPIMFSSINENVHLSRIRLHQQCKIANLEVRRITHLRMFMFKRRNNEKIVDSRNLNSRAQDALQFKIQRPCNENYNRNIYYNGAIQWNELTTDIRKTEKYDTFKSIPKKWSLVQIISNACTSSSYCC